MSDFDIKTQLELLNDYLDREMENIKFDCFVIKTAGDRQRPVTDVPRIHAPISTGRGYPYDCGDAPSLNSNHLSSFNDELMSAYIGEMSAPPTGDVSSYTSNSGDLTDSTGGLSEAIDGLSLCNGGVQSLPCVIAKKKSQAIDIINPATGEKVQLYDHNL